MTVDEVVVTIISGAYFIKGISNEGCENVMPITVIINPLPPTPVFTLSRNTLCQNETLGASVTNPTTPNTNINWSLPSGAIVLGGGGGPAGFGQGIKLTQIGANVFTLSYINSITGCSSSLSRTVTVNPLPQVSAADRTFCRNSGDQQLSPFGVSPLGGTWSGPNVFGNLFSARPFVREGNYTLTYSFTDVNGCRNSDNAVVRIINNRTSR